MFKYLSISFSFIIFISFLSITESVYSQNKCTCCEYPSIPMEECIETQWFCTSDPGSCKAGCSVDNVKVFSENDPSCMIDNCEKATEVITMCGGPSNTAPVPDGWYTLISESNSKCLEQEKYFDKKLDISACSLMGQQKWFLKRRSDGCYTIHSAVMDTCLDVTHENACLQWGPVSTEQCFEESNQRWQISKLSNQPSSWGTIGTYQIISKRNARCLDSKGMYKHRAIHTSCTNLSDQKWILKKRKDYTE